ncbi:MAG: hypothetical protein COX55_03615 [Zetaproteobacteria bacterium CG23_combo_of_CG06-09_8_20_14_all_54_7]|nr:MAG: hypothetical protein COX55_03615 [Zetaproteobacteria bacterium CG23_combo_of_CG06-09_8_20_14_all_54_7]
MKSIALTALLLLSTLAQADQISRFKYECTHVNKIKDLLTCSWRESETSGTILRIWFHRNTSTPKEKRERANYIADTLIHNFMVIGGRVVEKRATNAVGVEMYWYCSKMKHEMEMFCNDWRPLDKDEKKNWPGERAQ